MFSQNSSIQQSFNYPQTSKQLHFNASQAFKFKQNKLKNQHNTNNNNYLQQQPFNNNNNPHTPKHGNKLYFKIQVIKKVGRFLQNLKAGIVLSKPNLKTTQLYYLQSETKPNQHQQLYPYQSKPILILQALVYVILWINLWRNTYEVIFSPLTTTPLLQSISLLLYILSLYFFFNTQFKNEKLQLISNRNIIIQYYINQRLVYDVLIILVLIFQITPLDDQYKAIFYMLRIISLLMLVTVNQIGKKLQNIISVSTDTQIILSILSLIFKIFLLLHILSLAFTSLSEIQKKFNITTTWVQGNDLDVKTDFEQYIVGWYWSATIVATVGFGDITPVSNIFLIFQLDHVQRFFCSFIQVMCCVIFGYSVNYIGSLISMVGQSKRVYEKDMRKLNRYLLKQSLPDHLKSNIRLHFFNKNKIQQVYDPSSQETIMNKLTSNLTTQITQTRNKRILQMSKFIKPLCSQTIRKLSLVAKKMVFAPEQIIFSDKSQQMKLWIIEDGTVQELPTFINSKQDKPITIYDKDNQCTIGWINFLTSKPYRTLTRAKIFTLCYEIKQQQFFSIVKQNQTDYNKLLELKQLLIENNRIYINKCLSCSRFTHNVIQCPRIHFKPRGIYKLLIQQKKQQFLKCRQNRRKNINRSKFRYNWKALQSLNQHQAQIEDIVMKFNLKAQDDQESRRCSLDSAVHLLFRNKSSQQERSLQNNRSSQILPHLNLTKNQTRPQHSQKVIQIVDKEGINHHHHNSVIQQQHIDKLMTDRGQIINHIDKVYMGEANGYMEAHNLVQISKKYILYVINMCTNRNKI